MNAEISLLNKIINTGDVISPLSTGVESSFVLYLDEWKFVKDYYTDYKEAPSADIFFDKFDIDQFDTDGVIEHYIEELHKQKARQSLQEAITGAAVALKNQSPYATLNQLHAKLSKLGRDTRQVRDIDLIANVDERVESLRERIELRKSGKSIVGVPSGLSKIDANFGGWQKGDLIVIAGWTGHLKSYLAMYFAINAWKQGYRVLYFSLEMSHEQVGYRFDTMLSGGMFKNTELTHASESLVFDKYKYWADTELKDRHPFIVVTNENLDEVNQNVVQAKVSQWHPDVLVLDYHGLFDDVGGGTDTEKTKALSKAWKRIAVKNGTRVIDITAVTQDKKDLGETAPELSDMAWSKQLAYDSDLTLALCYREQDEQLEIVSRKNRRGKNFRCWLECDIDKGIFKEQLVFNQPFMGDNTHNYNGVMEDEKSG